MCVYVCVLMYCGWGLYLSTNVSLHESLCRILLCKGAIYKWAQWGRGGTSVIQKERLADGEGHGAGQHVGGHHAVHRKTRPGASQCHAATALPLLSVSHMCSSHEPLQLQIPWFRNSKNNMFSWQNFWLKELSSTLARYLYTLMSIILLTVLPVWSGGSWGSTPAVLDAQQQKRNHLNIQLVTPYTHIQYHMFTNKTHCTV